MLGRAFGKGSCRVDVWRGRERQLADMTLIRGSDEAELEVGVV